MVHFDGANVCFADGHVKWQNRVSPLFSSKDVFGFDNRNWNPYID
jgi:prepilin-type processing-associated H-X9-DG protein